ncbi:MAG: SpoIVB peptidase [Oscillospiraceae bacterium]
MKKFIKLVYFVGLVFTIVTFSIIININKDIPADFYTNDIKNFNININNLSSTKLSDDTINVHNSGIDPMLYEIKLFNLIPIKKINVKETNEFMLSPSGQPFGIKIMTDGVLVVGESEIKTKDDILKPYIDAEIKSGDILLSINEKKVLSNNDIKEIVKNSKGNKLKIKFISEGKIKESYINPALSENDNSYKIGIWVRDSSAGVGTMTFILPYKNVFAGLGHGVCDVDTGELLPIREGEIVGVDIIGVDKSTNGSPGQLKGVFSDDISLGNISNNTNIGVYGNLNNSNYFNKDQVPMKFKQEVKKGKAQIITTIDETGPQRFDIDIKKIDYNKNKTERNIVIEITDKKLLAKTGGIVQGMSGSPIIQDEKLVGAVTHVFVNDTKKGYGIFAENMIDMSNSVIN